MNKSLVIFGSSGKTGKEIIEIATAAGFTIREANRNTSPAKIIKGAGAVIIVFGPRPPYTDIFCEAKTKEIIQAMQLTGVARLICQTGAMIGSYPDNRDPFFSLMSLLFQKNSPQGHKDRAGQERVIKNSPLDWTIIKPPRLTESVLKPVTAGTDVKVGLLSTVSRKSLAKFIVDELTDPRFTRKTVFIKN